MKTEAFQILDDGFLKELQKIDHEILSVENDLFGLKNINIIENNPIISQTESAEILGRILRLETKLKELKIKKEDLLKRNSN